MKPTSLLFTCSWILTLLLARNQAIKGQTESDLRQWATQLTELYTENSGQEELSYLIEDILALRRSPLNLNTARRQDLERIFFLSDIQIENILFKRYSNGPFHSIYELQSVEGLPQATIRQMESLVFLGSPPDKKKPFKLWGDLFVRSGSTLEKAAGFEGDDPPFKGDRFKHYLRLETQTNRNFSAGFIAEKDPGEPLFQSYYSGTDFSTGYLRYARQKGLLREVVVGQFRIATGQGLVIRTGMRARKSTMVTSIRTRGPSFRPSLSASESQGQKGAYCTLAKGAIEITPFFSLRRPSTRIQTDSTGRSWISSLKEDGLHRTQTEINQRHNAEERIAGSQLAYKGRWFSISAGHLIYHLNKPIIPTPEPYNQFYFRGKENQNSWFSYTASTRDILFFGEIAMDDFSHTAFWNGIIWEAATPLGIALGYRYFSRQYQAPLAGPLTESGRFAGEQGFYAGIEWQLPHSLVVSSYLDRYRFAWLKYQINAPSSGFDWHLQLRKTWSKGQSLNIRYRHREKPENTINPTHEKSIETIVHDQIKVQFKYKASGNWQSSTLIQCHFAGKQENHYMGSLLAQDLRITVFKDKMTATCRYALFNTSHYCTRLYAYEPDILYKFSVPAYSGKGSRYLLLINYKLTPHWHIWARATRWTYRDRENSGSGYNLIPHPFKTDVSLQLRVKF